MSQIVTIDTSDKRANETAEETRARYRLALTYEVVSTSDRAAIAKMIECLDRRVPGSPRAFRAY